MAGATLAHGGLGICLLAVAVAGILCYLLYYRAPAMLGMQTGYPLYVVGSSTFGTAGGYVMPGILMGLLQIGWFAVATFVATDFILKGIGSTAGPGTMPFIIIGLIWGLSLSFVGAKGIQYVARIATYLNFIPLVMLLIVVFQTGGAGELPASRRTGEFVSRLHERDRHRHRLLRDSRRGRSGFRDQLARRERRELGRPGRHHAGRVDRRGPAADLRRGRACATTRTWAGIMPT